MPNFRNEMEENAAAAVAFSHKLGGKRQIYKQPGRQEGRERERERLSKDIK